MKKAKIVNILVIGSADDGEYLGQQLGIIGQTSRKTCDANVIAESVEKIYFTQPAFSPFSEKIRTSICETKQWFETKISTDKKCILNVMSRIEDRLKSNPHLHIYFINGNIWHENICLKDTEFSVFDIATEAAIATTSNTKQTYTSKLSASASIEKIANAA